jgi:hypothetical protein
VRLELRVGQGGKGDIDRDKTLERPVGLKDCYIESINTSISSITLFNLEFSNYALTSFSKPTLENLRIIPVRGHALVVLQLQNLIQCMIGM